MRLVVLLVALLMSVLAVAAEPPVSPEAKRHVDIGVEHYNAGRFAEAAKEFELAYRLSGRPALLFNIARAEAKLGHDEVAIAFLRRYLEERPNAPDAPAVLAEIEAHEKALAETQAKTQAESEAKEAEVQAARAQIQAAEAQRKAAEAGERLTRSENERQAAELEVERRRRDDRVGGARKSGIALTVIGPLLAAVGIGLGVSAMQTGNTVAGKSGEFADCCADLERRGHTLTNSGVAFDVIGGVVAVAGIALIGWSVHAGAHR